MKLDSVVLMNFVLIGKMSYWKKLHLYNLILSATTSTDVIRNKICFLTVSRVRIKEKCIYIKRGHNRIFAFRKTSKEIGQLRRRVFKPVDKSFFETSCTFKGLSLGVSDFFNVYSILLIRLCWFQICSQCFKRHPFAR